ncbi:glycosyltransferase family 4 protein [Pseudomonas benzenivorans]|uniref:Glycosyltransferase family 4 protein n=1 Tax=Pseudomonas benzenivorans TaxID=556533 RepID=A0ABY5H3U6_9PSED|nr:glycosyltransferase family 4 protein [Pseudomonas benzenivorans]UTW06972.1 glycosyltransferase family 4 protein [Pseudomonas benzenivorans]
MRHAPNFALYYASDAYSTSKKMMGRQAAGQALLTGIARTWPRSQLHGLGVDGATGQNLLQLLHKQGFSGQLQWSSLPSLQAAADAGALYYPAPPDKDLAAARNLGNPAAFSLMGVAHSLSSLGAMDRLAELILPPFKPWDALICPSLAVKTYVTRLHEEMREYWRESIGATRFVEMQLPVIPLGVDVPAFAPRAAAREAARSELGLGAEDLVLLFAGRLAFHAKANPVSLYQALEKLAGQRSVVCIEAGVFANPGMKHSYLTTQQALAPSVRFLWIDGHQPASYRPAWQAADIFVSLADNIQESFGLTPLEAMAAGLPVVVSDWDGYKDTVRDGIDGFRIPTVLPPAGAGADMALRHALSLDTYDRYIGHASLASVVEPQALAQALQLLADDPGLRVQMGAAGRARATAQYDWPVVLRRYAELAQELAGLRPQDIGEPPQPWPQRADPFHRFAHFSSRTLNGQWLIRARPDAAARLERLLSLPMTNYAFDSPLLSREALPALLATLDQDARQTVDSALANADVATQVGVRALMWLWKFDLLEVLVPATGRG